MVLIRFQLDDDLLTLHGHTDYVIEDVGGEEITKTVLFSVDMTEWLDEEDNPGMRAFNIANGDEFGLEEVSIIGVTAKM